jgi:hypothetical protein
MQDSKPSTPISRGPNWGERLFDFAQMRFDGSDAPPPVGVADLDMVQQIERALHEAQSAAEKAARTAPQTSSEPASRPDTVQSADCIVLKKAEILELAVQTWRLARRIESLDAEKFPRERKQLGDSLRRFQRILEVSQVETVDPVGQVYVDGWVEVEVVSWEAPPEGTDSTTCRILQTISPIVRREGIIIARGQVVATDITAKA